MKVYNTEPFGYSKTAINEWEKQGIEYIKGSWKELELEEEMPDIEILIVRLARMVNAEIFNKLPNLRFLISAATGHDHLDLHEIRKRSIQLISLRGEDEFLNTIPSTAEYTWALIMALIRNIPAANEHVKAGYWNRDLFRGYQLKKKRLGIVGYGRTGQKVAGYARAFDMKVSFYDPYIINNRDNEKVNSLEELLSKSDILSFHVHLKEDTHSMLNATNINQLNRNIFLVNTSRGKIWDEEAIANALSSENEDQLIGGVATDVLSTELDDFRKSPLWQAQQKGLNVIISPHIAGASWDAMWNCEEYIVERFRQINRFEDT